MPLTNNSGLSRRNAFAIGGASLFALTLTACGDGSAADGYPSKTLQIMAPAGAGGGWDSTARAIQEVLASSKLVKSTVEVYNVEGAAGTLGLAQLATKHQGDAHQLMVTGLVMVGGIVTNKAEITLESTSPIAILTAEQEVVVVPSDSKYETLADLMEDAKKAPESINWGGGSAGGTDQILVGMLAKAAGADPAAMKYIPYSGGGESKAALLSGDLTAAVSGVSEYAELVASGDLRVLAVSGAEGVDAGDGKPAPTIKEAGFEVELMNWRGIVAPPGISEDEKTAITELFDKMHDSEEWKALCEKQGWDDFYRSGSDAVDYFASETERINPILTDLGLAE